MDALIKKAGLEEEFKKLSEMFSDSFLIKGEETEELKEALHRAPDGLYKDIPWYLEDRLAAMDITRLDLLVRIMNYEPVGKMEAANVMAEFVPVGLVFAFTDGENMTFAVMKEVKDVLMMLHKPEMQEMILTLNNMRYVIRAVLGLYGVCTLKQLQNTLIKVTGGNEEEDKFKNLNKILEEYLPFMEEDGELWLDEKYVVSQYLETKKDYKRLLRKQKTDYYIPDDNVIMSYGQGKMLVKNPEYEAVFKLLNREIRDQAQTEAILEEASEYVIMEDWEIPEIMNRLYDWEMVFSSEKAAEKVTGALSRWLNTIRRWSECGHSRNELLKSDVDLGNIACPNQSEPAGERAKKIYPMTRAPAVPGKNTRSAAARNRMTR